MDLMTLVTHVLAAAAGYLGGGLLTRAALETVVEPHVDDDDTLTQPTPRHRNPWWQPGTWTLIAALVILGIAAQSYVAQRQAQDAEDDRDANLACLTKWSEAFTEAVSTRTRSTGEVSDAEGAREEALDRIIRAVYQSANTPGDAGEDDETRFREVLAEYVATSERLARLRNQNKQVRAEVPYPAAPSELCEEEER